MKKLHLLFITTLLFSTLHSQPPTYQQKLFYTCKIWGFVKYYHSAVSVCQVNWDSILVSRLPSIKTAQSLNDFNNALDTLILAAGPMSIVSGVLPDTLPPALKRNRNFAWISNPILRSDVQALLDTIKNNFRPHAGCWVQNNTYTGSNNSWLLFPHDSLMTTQDTYAAFPDEWNRLLLFFKHWNVLNYFNPYNYVHDKPWDSTLYNQVVSIANSPDPASFFYAFKKIAAQANDAHVEGLTWSSENAFPYYYGPRLVVNYIQNQYVVVKSGVAGISRGDAIVTLAGLTPAQWEDSLRPYVSAGNLSVFRRFVCQYIICGPFNSTLALVSQDSLGTNHSFNLIRNVNTYGTWFSSYYPNDSLATVHWKKISCGIGYVNMGILQPSEVNAMYAGLKNAPAIIFDIRNYPNGTAWPIADLMYPGARVFAKLTQPDVTYPGTCSWIYDSLGVNGNPTPYSGKVILLINQETQSQAEYSCMILNALPNVVKIGSQTAATDGNISYFNISKDIQTGFTTLGVYYPNGDSTERIGIRPDVYSVPTRSGIRHHADEVLEAALRNADCLLAVKADPSELSEVLIYPNPATSSIHISINHSESAKSTFQLIDLSGRILKDELWTESETSFLKEIDLHSVSDGMYVVIVKTGKMVFVKKVIKRS